MKGYELTAEAQSDLDAIGDYLVSEIEEELRKLVDMPSMGHFREDLLDKHYKFWSVYSYVIVYRWEARPIQIVAVVHGARHLQAFLARRRTSWE
jgi:plasmid stabilization system protein ParE